MSMAGVCSIALPIMILFVMSNVKKFNVMMKTMIKSVIAGALVLRGKQRRLQLRPYQDTEHIEPVGVL